MIAAKPNSLVARLSAPPIPSVVAWSREYKGEKGRSSICRKPCLVIPRIRRCFGFLPRRPDNRR